MTRLGYQIPNFTYPGVGPDRLFATIRQQAIEAEASGFDTVFVMDHFYQLAMLGRPEQDMIESYTLLAALAQHTHRVRLSTLVTGNTYRHPSLLAKTVTALDIVSGGRAQLGIGAGGSSSNIRRSASSSAPSPTVSSDSRSRCRLSFRCCVLSSPRSRASGTAWTQR
jgi:alkanesulfonate monooxygenase SsuD/methylene tetrahydromethanopterin reductase-like flavin-dependent oxidoreductase (luciferase family)